jgi:hypothetical protein
MVNDLKIHTEWWPTILDKSITAVGFYPPYTWGFYFGKKPIHGLLISLQNEQPSYHVASPLSSTQLPEVHHRLAHVLAHAIVTDVNFSESQGHALVMTLKHAQHTYALTVQLAPYLPRIYLHQDTTLIFDSILGWYPKVALTIRPSVWKIDPLLVPAMIQLQSNFILYRQLLNQYLKKKQHRHDALMSDQDKHQRYLHYLELGDALKAEPGLPWSAYANPFALPLPKDTILTDFKGMQWLYHQYKKAKSGLAHVHEQLEASQQHIDDIVYLMAATETNNPEHLTQLETKLKTWRLISGVKPKPELVRHDAPYWFTHEGRRFSFGKNAKQNQKLTFDIAKKSEIFLHLQDAPGAHVIVHHAAFDHDVLVQGAQLVLALAGKISGQVTYAKVGSLKATTKLGQVIVKDARTIQVNGLDSLWQPLIQHAQRY